MTDKCANQDVTPLLDYATHADKVNAVEALEKVLARIENR